MTIITIHRPNKSITLDIDKLKEYLHYNPTKGTLYWLKGNRKGLLAGNVKVNRNGVWHRIGYEGNVYSTSHLIWLIQTNTYPIEGIHYLDLDATNLKWCNLELNIDNVNKRKRKIPINNSSGFKGICVSGNKYVAYIGGKTIVTTRDLKEAIEKRLTAEQLLDY